MGVIDYLRAIYPLNTVHNTNDPSVLVHGTFSGAITAGTITSLPSGTMTVSGNIQGAGGSGQALVGNPVQIGGGARTTDPTAVTSGQLITLFLDSLGKLVNLPGAPNDLHLDGQVQIAQVAAAALIPNQGSGKKIVVQSLLVTCSGSQIVQAVLTGGTNTRTLGFASPGGGFSMNAGGAALYITSASTALSVNCDVTSTINVFASGYVISN